MKRILFHARAKKMINDDDLQKKCPPFFDVIFPKKGPHFFLSRTSIIKGSQNVYLQNFSYKNVLNKKKPSPVSGISATFDDDVTFRYPPPHHLYVIIRGYPLKFLLVMKTKLKNGQFFSKFAFGKQLIFNAHIGANVA